MMCDQRLWQAQAEALSPDIEVIHAPITGGDTIGDIAGNLLAMLPEKFALAGLSMGGIVAFELLRRAPERISRLALFDTNYKPDPPERQRLRDRQIHDVNNGQLVEVMREELKPNYLAACHRNNAVLLDRVLAMGLEQGEQVFVAQSRALQTRPDSAPTLAQIRCPTLVACGEEDALCPPALHAEMAAQIPDAELHLIGDCGHLAPMEQPEAVTDLLRNWIFTA